MEALPDIPAWDGIIFSFLAEDPSFWNIDILVDYVLTI